MLRFFNYKDKKLKLNDGADLVGIALIVVGVAEAVQTVVTAKA